MASTRLSLKASHRKLGLWLAFVAGAANAGIFILVGHYSSHMTGIASSIGDAVALSDLRGGERINTMAAVAPLLGTLLIEVENATAGTMPE